MTEQKGLRHPSASEGLETKGKKRRICSKMGIVINGRRDPETIIAAIEEWLVPLLVDRFIAEHHRRPLAFIDGNSLMNGKRRLQ